MKQQFAWAIVTRNGALAIECGQCPIFWHRKVARRVAVEKFGHNSNYRVIKITILEVFR